MSAARSYLYVPGDRRAVLARALDRGADALILDLEDAVAPNAKGAARSTVAEFLTTRRETPVGTELWVRVNSGPMRDEDLDAVVVPGLTGVCVAKADDVAVMHTVDASITRLETSRGLRPASVSVSALVESAGGLLRAAEIAAAPRVQRLQLGEADLCAELGVQPGPDERELLWARSRIVAASAAAGIDPPVAPVSTDFRDLDRMRESTVALKRMGFRGRACIHPAQLGVVNEVFTPSRDEVDRARELVAAYDAAVSAGHGAFTDSSGRMVDLAVVRAARRTLAAAR